MNYNYFKIIIRNFMTDRMYTIIIVFGLAVGISAALMITQYVHFELSFDKNYKDSNQIYYAYMKWQGTWGYRDMMCHPSVGPLFKRSVPEVESFARFTPVGMDKGDEFVLRREENGKTLFYSRENDLYYADASILDIFSMPMIAGDRATALKEPYTVVITRSLAEKFFGDESPLDKTLKIQAWNILREYRITGITEDPLRNSSLQYNAIFSLETANRSTYGNDLESIWIHPIYKTFIKLQPGSDIVLVEQKINEAGREPLGLLEKDYKIKESIHLYPFSGFHFYQPDINGQQSSVAFTGDRRLLNYFLLLAALILIISWANYINLTTARALQRAKEVGLRKVNGASKKDLVVQFLIEFFFMNLISMMLAFTIAQLLFSKFALAIGSKAEWVLWAEPWFWVAVILFVILSTFISGIYPAFVMSNYNPSKVLKGTFSRSKSGTVIRKALVLTQFGLSVLLLMSIYVISRQLVFMQNKDLGMSIDQVLVIRTGDLDTTLNRLTALRQWKAKAENFKYIKNIAAASDYPGDRSIRVQMFYRSEDPDKEQSAFLTNVVSENYFNTMGVQLLFGRDFRDDQAGEEDKVVINQKLAQDLGFDDGPSIIGERITLTRNEKEYEIIGVVSDFNYSMKSRVWGEVFFHNRWNNQWSVTYDYFLLKVSTDNLPQAMSEMENEWKAVFNDAPFDYFFLDSYFDTFYKEDRQFAGVFGFFSLIGVLITCMGLFGLSLYDTGRRTKEIGIRKSLGGSARSIMWLFSKDYIRLILIASTVGLPIGAWLLNGWLKNYPNRITLHADVIFMALLLMLCIAIFTVGYHTYQTAHMDPVKSLRNE